MPNDYTEDELSYMREHYSQKTNEEIAEELDRTVASVRVKAHKMNLEKNEDTIVHRRIGIDNYDSYILSKEVSDNKDAKFISGLVVGESSFVYEEKQDSFEFSLAMSEQDRTLVKYVEEFFGIGKVYHRDEVRENEQDMYNYRICSEQKLIEDIIPFMESNLNRGTNKWRKYVSWRNRLLEKHGFSFKES